MALASSLQTRSTLHWPAPAGGHSCSLSMLVSAKGLHRLNAFHMVLSEQVAQHWPRLASSVSFTFAETSHNLPCFALTAACPMADVAALNTLPTTQYRAALDGKNFVT